MCQPSGSARITTSFHACALSPGSTTVRAPEARPAGESASSASTHQCLEPGVEQLTYRRQPPSGRRTRAGRSSEAQANALSVRVELQADCYAGVWAHYSQQSKHWLDAGDIESAINAAQQIGDDTLQKSAGRAVVPESFTHGTSAQRVHWFDTGWKTGSVKACDTFSARQL